MTQEEKDLLLKDLCGRLPYGVLLQYTQETFAPQGEIKVDVKLEIDDMLKHRLKLLDFKPYLRPMSSMTEEEEIEYDTTFVDVIVNGRHETTMTYKSFEFLNSKHFDYRGLIPMGLALEAPKGMYC